MTSHNPKTIMQQNPKDTPWTFQDRKCGIEFIVTYDRDLAEPQLHWIADTIIQKHRESLFQMWKLEEKNRDWQGDVERKKDELIKLSPLPRTIEVQRDYADVCLRGFRAA